MRAHGGPFRARPMRTQGPIRACRIIAQMGCRHAFLTSWDLLLRLHYGISHLPRWQRGDILLCWASFIASHWVLLLLVWSPFSHLQPDRDFQETFGVYNFGMSGSFLIELMDLRRHCLHAPFSASSIHTTCFLRV